MSDAWRQWEGEVVDGHFHLRKFLGGSDHSAVFLAQRGDPAEKVALKFVEANPATMHLQLSRWERTTKLSHPHLIRVFQGGLCQLGSVKMLYVVTELADDDLGQILSHRPLTSSETQYLLRSVLEVLAYLHGRGLVHGRLKPRNIMAVDEELKVSSDGISTIGETPIGVLQPGVYDPPEVLKGGLSPAGDVWSLGITLTEALTQRPSAGEGIRGGDPALPQSVPAPFLEIARQCLRLDPQRRWTVADIAARLVPAAPAPKKRSVSPYVFLGLVALAALTLLLAGPKLLTRRPAHPPPESQQRSAKDPPHGTPTNTPLPKPTENTTNSRQAAVPRRQPVAETGSTPLPAVASANGQPALVEAGAVREQVVPPVPPKALETIQGTIRVVVAISVDASGKVSDATLLSPGPSHYFANLALAASQKWKFTPAHSAGGPVPSEWLLRYEFKSEGITAHPTQVSPKVK
jgi:TonB family protein